MGEQSAQAKDSLSDFEYVPCSGGIRLVQYHGKDSRVTIPETIDGKKVKELGRSTFSPNRKYSATNKDDSPKITYVSLPSGVTFIESYALADLDELEEVVFNGEVKAFDYCAFKNDYHLSKIKLPASLHTIGREAFHYCSRLVDLQLPENLSVIEENAFQGCHSLREVVIPESVTELGIMAFLHCERLERVTVPASIRKLEWGVFELCIKLKEVSLPDTMNYICYNAFSGCKSLESIKLPEDLVSIGREAFANCVSLRNVSLPIGLKEIHSGAFQNCDKLELSELPEFAQVAEDALPEHLKPLLKTI